MTKEELMKPRYEVVADYPFSRYQISDILEIVIGREEIWDNCRTGQRAEIAPMDFPAVFRKLNWWEHRKPEEMPEYVRITHKILLMDSVYPEYIKVEDWRGSIALFGNYALNCEYFEPATETEYTNYITQTK